MEYPQIPGVVIDGELGRGAHSVVYSGRQGGVRCAIKLPRTKARWTRWIYREAVSLARVKHSRLPGVFEVGDVDGLPYLIMELVEGETLAGRLAAGPIEQDTVLTVARQLADVLAAVHQAGLVHRDVKPRNIVVEHGAMSLKLVDFGFATPMERVGTVDAAGTAAYAAPEQLAPPGTVDARADLYAVGRVLFECLYGEREVMRADGPWGDAAVAALVARGVRPALAEVVGGLLQTDPDERYSSADALGADLELLSEGSRILGPAGYRRARFRCAKLVGRRGELERVLAACRSATTVGTVAVIRGARGSGKTALLKAVDAQLRVSGRSVLVACRQDDSPLSTLRRILEAYCDEYLGSQGSSTEKIRDAVGNLAPVADLIAPSRMRTVLGAAAPGSSPSVDDPFLPADSLAEGAAQILLALATKLGAWALVVDDAQWMDPASAGALARVAHRIGEGPLALVLGARSELAGALERFAELRGDRSVRLELSRLASDEVAELVSSHLGEPRADPELVARINAMAGGTPLGVLEVLGAFLDAGALRPHARTWIFDAARMEGVRLPRGAIALLGRRLVELPTATLRVLEAAAILGTSFDDVVVARMLALKSDELAYALASARRAGVIIGGEHAENRFVHDSVREMLVEDLADAERRRLHDRAAQALEALPDPTFEELCATALHYAAGEPGRDPASAYRVARAAGEAAVVRFDSATALRFLGQARNAALAARVDLDAAFFQSVGEAELRLGSLDESLAAFKEALQHADDVLVRARILGRLSWVYQAKADAERAWDMLASAFAALGRQMPNESVGSVALTSARVVRWGLGRLLDRPAARRQAEVDLLAQLHYQNVRLGIEYGMPARVLQSSLGSLTVSDVASSEATRARARVLYGLVLTVLGRREAGAREMAEAKARATRHGDPVTISFCVQLKGIALSLTGDLDEALILLRECVDVYGPWLELNEYCQLVSTADIIQSARGRSDEAWSWMERAIERLRRTGTRALAPELVVFHRARAALAAVGRDLVDDPWLAREFEALPRGGAGQGFHRMVSWGPRARYYLEAGALGEEFDALDREFALDGHGPRGAHPALVEYFIAVAHGRIHQVLRAPPSERGRRLTDLRAAVTALRVAAKIPLHRAHALVAEAFLAWFEHHASLAHKRLAEAEAVADQQSAPWVLYAVARCRAHMLREAGRMEAARDQARVAELFAREHGAVTRARWIREEFALETSPAASTKLVVSRGSSSSRANRQLATLLQIARAPRLDLRSEQQAAAILDELMDSLEAERGAIWFQPDSAVDGITATRHRASSVSGPLAPDSARGALLRDVRLSGQPWPPSEPGAPAASGDHPFDSSRVAAVPLFLYEKPVGALCIERGAEHEPFELADRNLLALLSHQVPIALEVARLLAEREQLHASLQHAKKMEAMGTMAGGLAHDFNNMLAAMKVALGAAQERAALDSELTVELDIIAEATTRASQLTSQLLSFSRHQPLSVSVHDVNQLISTLEPMLRRVVGSGVETQVKLSPAVDAVEVDQGSFDQALVNLLINARDAMPSGGTLTISTRNVVLGPAAAQRASLQPGEYVEVEVSDTGEGMSTEVMSRIFEPFFTTKPAGAGSGLGLAMVYAFARNCGGSIEVSSEVGRGTQFRLYFKRVERQRTSRPTRSSPPMEPAVAELREDGPDTILVVDDDDLVRRSISKILERHGYRVVAASGSNEALDVVQEQGGRIALVILDVLMPGITGPELGRRLFDLKLPAKLLFVSGFSPESIPIDNAQVASEMLLQKPFSQTALLERVRLLMYS